MGVMRVILFLWLFSSCKLQQVVIGAQLPPLTKSALEGLSRESLISMILGNTVEDKVEVGTEKKNETKTVVDLASTAVPIFSHRRANNTNNTAVSFEQDKFYIYPLDKKYWWRWPDPNSSCTAHNQVGHNHAMNSGQSVSSLFVFRGVGAGCL